MYFQLIPAMLWPIVPPTPHTYTICFLLSFFCYCHWFFFLIKHYNPPSPNFFYYFFTDINLARKDFLFLILYQNVLVLSYIGKYLIYKSVEAICFSFIETKVSVGSWYLYFLYQQVSNMVEV